MSKENRLFITLESYNDSESYTLKQHIFKSIEKEEKYSDRKWVGNKSLCGCVIVGDENEKNAEFETLLNRNEKIDENNLCKSCYKIYMNEKWKDLENAGLDEKLTKWK